MTSRERVLSALRFAEPDRVPLALGETVMSGIMAQALDRLRRYLGLASRRVRVYEVFQMLGEVEADLVERLGIDTLPVEPPELFFGLRRENYRPWRLWDGTEVLMPGQFQVEADAQGDLLLHQGGDAAKPVVAVMPRNGFYFDAFAARQAETEFDPPAFAEVRAGSRLSPADAEFLQARAEYLRRTTDKALVLGCWGKLGLPWVGSIPDFLVLLATRPDYVRDLFKLRTEVALENLETLQRHLGGKVDVVGLDGADFGTQRGELFAPGWFADLFVPFFTAQNRWVHANTAWKTWQHTCGSITRLLPLLVESGLDILNPVQCSAAGMDPGWLKTTFGGRLVFWGGGVDTQRTLPFGTPAEVAAEVAERVRVFAPGGGYVFNPIHNIQHGTPPANIVAAYETARRVGTYPILGGRSSA